MSRFLIRGRNSCSTGHYLKMAEIYLNCVKYYWTNRGLPNCSDNNWHLLVLPSVQNTLPISTSGAKEKKVCLNFCGTFCCCVSFPRYPNSPPISFPLKKLSYVRSRPFSMSAECWLTGCHACLAELAGACARGCGYSEHKKTPSCTKIFAIN